MSGVFRPEQNFEITATDDPDFAKAHGLTEFDEDLQQYVKRDVTRQGDNEDPAREDAEAEPEIVVEQGGGDGAPAE